MRSYTHCSTFGVAGDDFFSSLARAVFLISIRTSMLVLSSRNAEINLGPSLEEIALLRKRGNVRIYLVCTLIA